MNHKSASLCLEHFLADAGLYSSTSCGSSRSVSRQIVKLQTCGEHFKPTYSDEWAIGDQYDNNKHGTRPIIRTRRPAAAQSKNRSTLLNFGKIDGVRIDQRREANEQTGGMSVIEWDQKRSQMQVCLDLSWLAWRAKCREQTVTMTTTTAAAAA